MGEPYANVPAAASQWGWRLLSAEGLAGSGGRRRRAGMGTAEERRRPPQAPPARPGPAPGPGGARGLLTGPRGTGPGTPCRSGHTGSEQEGTERAAGLSVLPGTSR